jgi:hypothetical protein
MMFLVMTQLNDPLQKKNYQNIYALGYIIIN